MVFTERQEQELMVNHNGVIQVRDITVIERDGVEVVRTNHRHVVDVDDDVTDESIRLKAVASQVWTQEVRNNRASEKANSAAQV